MKLSDCSEEEQRDLAVLEARIGRAHLRQRLSLEGEHEAHVVRPGTRFFHLDNWYSLQSVIRVTLTLTGMHARGRRNVLDIRLRDNEVRLARLPAAFEGFRLLHLSDLHIDMSESHLERLIESVRGVAHDVCVLTGDFRFRTFGPYAPTLAALARLRPHLGDAVYAVLGNHDTIRMVPGMEAIGIPVLMNESVRIERQGEVLMLVGIDDAHYFRTHNFHKAAAELAPDDCAILLSHTPEPYRLAAHADFSLMLSGHTHGGQICLPGGIPILTDSTAPRATARGAWEHRGMSGYTSVGCGSSLVDVRFNCPPEITLHRLRRG
ncbi:metallophosphoesterase [Variovorax sp. GT1P44]|uniref:metallophosphoesterase n=1 Tax=Variovorax sp. GT1P44 TaxID=3443742 RepID=UPI003F4493E7